MLRNIGRKFAISSAVAKPRRIFTSKQKWLDRGNRDALTDSLASVGDRGAGLQSRCASSSYLATDTINCASCAWQWCVNCHDNFASNTNFLNSVYTAY